jgi:hypothetical protein
MGTSRLGEVAFRSRPRQYSVTGERRSFALQRPANGDARVQEAIKRCILDAYQRSKVVTPDRPDRSPGGAGSAPPPGRAVFSRWMLSVGLAVDVLAERTLSWKP